MLLITIQYIKMTISIANILRKKELFSKYYFMENLHSKDAQSFK